MDEIEHEIRRCSALDDESLRANVEALAGSEQSLLAEFLIHVAEMDNRDVCERHGFSSVFAYLTRGLGYSEWESIARIKSARAASRFPSIYRMIKSGSVRLTALMMLEPFLTSENHRSLLLKARGKRKHEVDRLVADLRPAAREPQDRIRALPAATQPPPPPATGSPAPTALTGTSAELPGLAIGPEAADSSAERDFSHGQGRQQFSFVASSQVHRLFLQARDLLRHRFPAGLMEDVIGEALRRLIEAELPGVKAAPPREGPHKSQATLSRRVPQWVREEVWRRDSGRCAYVGATGIRCDETAWLELDHIVPWSCGGRSDSPSQIRLLCRRHNASEARRILGDRARARRRAPTVERGAATSSPPGS